MKKGLILEGGAMRGLFTAGILDVFLENGVVFDGIVGVSAGAAFGANYKSKQAGRVIRYNTAFARDKRYCSLSSLIKTGDLYNADFCYHELPEKLDRFDRQTFTNDPTDFFVVCTDVMTGKPVYKRLTTLDYDELEWMRASASMPLVSRIVSVGGYRLLDGGISDSIPVKYFERSGYGKNVVVLTRPAGYRKKQNAFLPLLKLCYKKYPAFYETLKNRYLRYNETLDYIAEREKSGDLFVIRPDKPLAVGKTEHDPEKMRAAYGVGREKGANVLSAVAEFLK